MRFEIKTGGLIAILCGLTALSGVVFVLGLRAGYDIGQQSEPVPDKVATDYPLTAPPPAPAAAQTTTAEAPAAGASVAPAAPEQPPPAPPPSTPELASNPPSGAVARPKPPSVSPPAETDEGSDTEASDEDTDEPPPPPVRAGRKPYNIEIQAAMDSTSASQMVKRLAALGYQPHLTPTELNGATWYKVEVGPYATQAEAAAAETALREKYNATYGHGGTPARPAEAGDGPEE
jgi:DedD protein